MRTSVSLCHYSFQILTDNLCSLQRFLPLVCQATCICFLVSLSIFICLSVYFSIRQRHTSLVVLPRIRQPTHTHTRHHQIYVPVSITSYVARYPYVGILFHMYLSTGLSDYVCFYSYNFCILNTRHFVSSFYPPIYSCSSFMSAQSNSVDH